MKILQNKLNRKLIGAILTVFFMLQQILILPASSYALENSLPLPAAKIQIPVESGNVEAVNLASANSPTIIHLQNAHGNNDAQNNIHAILNYLSEKEGVNLVLLEGAKGEIHPEILKIKDQKNAVNLQTAEYMQKQAQVTGAEVFLLEKYLVEKTVPAYGIEDASAYRQNRQSFQKVLRARKQSEDFLKKMDMQIESLTAPYVSSPLKNFLRSYESYETNLTDISVWMSTLRELSGKYLAVNLEDPIYQNTYPAMVRYYRLKALEPKLDRIKAENEKKELINKLHSLKVPGSVIDSFERSLNFSNKGISPAFSSEDLVRAVENLIRQTPADFSFSPYPHLKDAIQFAVFSQELEGASLFLEISKIENQLSDKLARTDAEKKLLALFKDYRLLKKVFALELSRKEYESIILLKESLRPSAILNRFSEINGAKQVRLVEFDHGAEINQLFDLALDFYKDAVRRDTVMSENVLKVMAELKQNKAVMVTGGFHSEGMENFFKEKGFSYVRVSPKIHELSDNKAYIRNMLEEDSDIKNSKIENILFEQLPGTVTELGGNPALHEKIKASAVAHVTVQNLTEIEYQRSQAEELRVGAVLGTGLGVQNTNEVLNSPELVFSPVRRSELRSKRDWIFGFGIALAIGLASYAAFFKEPIIVQAPQPEKEKPAEVAKIAPEIIKKEEVPPIILPAINPKEKTEVVNPPQVEKEPVIDLAEKKRVWGDKEPPKIAPTEVEALSKLNLNADQIRWLLTHDKRSKQLEKPAIEKNSVWTLQSGIRRITENKLTDAEKKEYAAVKESISSYLQDLKKDGVYKGTQTELELYYFFFRPLFAVQDRRGKTAASLVDDMSVQYMSIKNDFEIGLSKLNQNSLSSTYVRNFEDYLTPEEWRENGGDRLKITLALSLLYAQMEKYKEVVWGNHAWSRFKRLEMPAELELYRFYGEKGLGKDALERMEGDIQSEIRGPGKRDNIKDAWRNKPNLPQRYVTLYEDVYSRTWRYSNIHNERFYRPGDFRLGVTPNPWFPTHTLMYFHITRTGWIKKRAEDVTGLNREPYFISPVIIRLPSNELRKQKFLLPIPARPDSIWGAVGLGDRSQQRAEDIFSFFLSNPSVWKQSEAGELQYLEQVFDADKMRAFSRQFRQVWDTDYIKDLYRPDYGKFLMDDFLETFISGKYLEISNGQMKGDAEYIDKLAKELRTQYPKLPYDFQVYLQVPLLRYEAGKNLKLDDDYMSYLRADLYQASAQLARDIYVNNTQALIGSAYRLGITDTDGISKYIRYHIIFRPLVENLLGRPLVLSNPYSDDAGRLSAFVNQIYNRGIDPDIWLLITQLALKDSTKKSALELYNAVNGTDHKSFEFNVLDEKLASVRFGVLLSYAAEDILYPGRMDKIKTFMKNPKMRRQAIEFSIRLWRVLRGQSDLQGAELTIEADKLEKDLREEKNSDALVRYTGYIIEQSRKAISEDVLSGENEFKFWVETTDGLIKLLAPKKRSEMRSIQQSEYKIDFANPDNVRRFQALAAWLIEEPGSSKEFLSIIQTRSNPFKVLLDEVRTGEIKNIGLNEITAVLDIKALYKIWSMNGTYRDLVVKYVLKKIKTNGDTERAVIELRGLIQTMIEAAPNDLRGGILQIIKEYSVGGILKNYYSEKVLFSPDGSRIALVENQAVQLWDSEMETKIAHLTGHYRDIEGIKFSPDGTLLATAGMDGQVIIWNARTGDSVVILSAGILKNSISFSPDGKRLGVLRNEGEVANADIWDIASKRVIKTFPTIDANKISFSPEGDRVLVSSQRKAAVFNLTQRGDLSKGKLGTYAESSDTLIFDSAFSPNGEEIAVAIEYLNVFSRGIQIRDAKSYKQKRFLPQMFSKGDILSMAYSPDGRRIATVNSDRSLHILDAETGVELLSVRGLEKPHQRDEVKISFSSDGTKVVANFDSANKKARVWDLTKLQIPEEPIVEATNSPANLPVEGDARSEMRSTSATPNEKQQLVLEILKRMAKRQELPNAVDLIIAFGSDDIKVAEEAAKLYFAGKTPRILVSGRFGKNIIEDGQTKPEAHKYRDRLLELGVPAEAILVEDQSKDMDQNGEFSRDLLQRESLIPKSAIFIHSPLLIIRGAAVARNYFTPLGTTIYEHAADLPNIPLDDAKLNKFAQRVISQVDKVAKLLPDTEGLAEILTLKTKLEELVARSEMRKSVENEAKQRLGKYLDKDNAASLRKDIAAERLLPYLGFASIFSTATGIPNSEINPDGITPTEFSRSFFVWQVSLYIERLSLQKLTGGADTAIKVRATVEIFDGIIAFALAGNPEVGAEIYRAVFAKRLEAVNSNGLVLSETARKEILGLLGISGKAKQPGAIFVDDQVGITHGLLAALRDVMGATTPIVVFVNNAQQEEIVAEFNKDLKAKGKNIILTAKTVKDAVAKANKFLVDLGGVSLGKLTFRALLDPSQSYGALADELKQKDVDILLMTEQMYDKFAGIAGVEAMLTAFRKISERISAAA